MFISRISLLSDADPREIGEQLGSADRYREHQLIWKLLPRDPGAERDFLFRADIHNGRPCYLLLSQRQPEADPAIWKVETKPYRPKIRRGERLAFSLRANPIVARKGEDGRSHRHDIVMDAKKQLGWSRLPSSERPSLSRLIQQAGETWLKQRLARHGAALQLVRVDRYLPQKNGRGEGQAAISHSTLDFEGILEVTDPEPFIRLLYNGLGPAKAFGCGLLLVRRL